jgi:hypothetical protein
MHRITSSSLRLRRNLAVLSITLVRGNVVRTGCRGSLIIIGKLLSGRVVVRRLWPTKLLLLATSVKALHPSWTRRYIRRY